MKSESRCSRTCGFLPSILITGLLLYGGLWAIQHLEQSEPGHFGYSVPDLRP